MVPNDVQKFSELWSESSNLEARSATESSQLELKSAEPERFALLPIKSQDFFLALLTSNHHRPVELVEDSQRSFFRRY